MEFSKIPIIGFIFEWLDTADVDYGVFIIIFGVILFFVLTGTTDITQGKVFAFLFATAPLWLPILSFSVFFYLYMDMVGMRFYNTNGRRLFELRLPQEVFKSPEAMENVFNIIYSAQSPDNYMETYLDGKRPLPFSFELVSKGGDVRFYVNLPGKKAPELFITNMYAQYPGIEIVEQELDYTAAIPHDIGDRSFMSFHFIKKEDQELPIKTYIDFGLDKLPKEEEKTDPMTPLLETLASIRPEQEIWVQFLCTAHRKSNFKNGQLKKSGTWESKVMEKIDKMMQRDPETKLGAAEFEGMARLTTGERDTIEAMERNAGKYPYHFNCRWIYMSHKNDHDYDGAFYARMIRALAAWDIRGRNGIGMIWRTDFDYMFLSDPFFKKTPALKRQELKEYKQRKFYPKVNNPAYSRVMTAEELATIYHIPGSVAMTPSLNRVPSTRGEAPNNLPIG